MARFVVHFLGHSNGEFSYNVDFEVDTKEKDSNEEHKLACNSAIACARMLVDQLRLVPVSTKTKQLREALEFAQHELTTLHGLRVIDTPDADCSWVIDTSNADKLIQNALDELN